MGDLLEDRLREADRMASQRPTTATTSPDLRMYYVFLIQRPSDSKPWPMVFENLGQAEGYPARVSKVYEVSMEKVGG